MTETGNYNAYMGQLPHAGSGSPINDNIPYWKKLFPSNSMIVSFKTFTFICFAFYKVYGEWSFSLWKSSLSLDYPKLPAWHHNYLIILGGLSILKGL